jgi:hypothetical protein
MIIFVLFWTINIPPADSGVAIRRFRGLLCCGAGWWLYGLPGGRADLIYS